MTKQYEEVTPISDLKKRGGSPGMEPYKVPYYFTSKKKQATDTTPFLNETSNSYDS